MQGIGTSTMCGRSTEEAIIHDGEWVDEVLTNLDDKSTSVCAKCRACWDKANRNRD